MPSNLSRAGALIASAAALAACSVISPEDDGPVVIEFFQFKPEAIETFDRVIEEFEADHPGIDVQQNAVPDAETAIRTRMVRGDIPDVMTLNGNFTLGELASAGVLYDFSDEPVLDDVNPAVIDIVTDLGQGGEGEVNAVPFANNASGIIYNVDLFEEHGVEVPQTWDELIAAAETFAAAGITPITGTLQEAWTTLPAWNAITANVQGPDFYERLRADETSFQEVYPPVAEQLEMLFSYVQADAPATNYNAGNQAFAQGESAMYVQGSYAIPAIRSFEPDFDIGTFALPAEQAEDTVVISGVDVAITMGRDGDDVEESLMFIEYLMRPEVVAAYAEEQSAIPTLQGLDSEDPALAGLLPYFEEGRVVGFTDHQIPPSIPLAPLTQQFVFEGDDEAYLTNLDQEWDKVAARRF